MSFFIILLDDDGKRSEVLGSLDDAGVKNYPHHAADNVVLVKADTTAEQIAVLVGIKGRDESSISGAVIKLNRSYAGYTSGSLWDFLDE